MLFNMTPDEFFEKLKECLADAMFATEPNEGVKVEKHYVYGLQGLCDLLGCSKLHLHVLMPGEKDYRWRW